MPSRVFSLDDGEKPYTVTGILETENISRIFTVWISESAVEPESPYELRFRFAGSKKARSTRISFSPWGYAPVILP